jgi:hydroxypyruvate isomerase
MIRFTANLGLLWTDRSLANAIRAAKAAGFDAVECHCPYAEPIDEVNSALSDTGLEMIGLNTRGGNVAKGEFGLSAIVGREPEARTAIDEAITYARSIGAGNIHVLAGLAEGDQARACFVSNLDYACTQAQPHGINILIEPINSSDVPSYYLTITDQAVSIIDEVGAENLRLMFDCYHVQIMEGNLSRRLEKLMPYIGNIQFASVPDRGPPDHGELNYAHIFETIVGLGYHRPLSAEYKPRGDTDASLGWMAAYR